MNDKNETTPDVNGGGILVLALALALTTDSWFS